MKIILPTSTLGILALFLTTSLVCHADLELQTSINDVHHRGSHVLAGTVAMIVSADDYPDASPSTPVFYRITLSHQAVLGETMVDQTSGDPNINQPVFLAMTVDSLDAHLEANPETVSIVRWVAGEEDIWLRINQSSSEWISKNGVSMPPTENDLVVFRFGYSARQIYEELDGKDPNQINLPFNTRNPNTNGNLADATSTLSCLNLSQSSLGSDGIESLLELDLLTYDETAQISPGVYGPGNLIGFLIPSERIARGRTIFCDIESAQTPQRSGVTSNQFRFTVDCHQPGPNLTLDLYNGSFLTFEGDPSKGIGFSPESASFLFGGVPSGMVTVDPNSSFSSNGKTLYSRIFLAWDLGTTSLQNAEIDVALQVFHEAPNEAPVVDWHWNMVNHDGHLDEAPFNGPQQGRRCLPYEAETGSGVLQLVQAIPTLTTWGLICFLLLFMASALWVMRKGSNKFAPKS